MKKILSLFVLLIITLTSILLCGCSKQEEDTRELLMLQPEYIGEAVTDTDHTFRKEDFKVMAHFAGYASEEVSDFTFEVVELLGGYYTVRFNWNGNTEELLVPLSLDIYE